jgi:hypothetical protein
LNFFEKLRNLKNLCRSHSCNVVSPFDVIPKINFYIDKTSNSEDFLQTLEPNQNWRWVQVHVPHIQLKHSCNIVLVQHVHRYLIYKSNSSVCMSVWQTGQGRGGYACISRPLSSSSVTRIFGPIRWFCLSVVTNRAGQGRARAGRPGQTPAHWTCWLYIGSLGKTGGPVSNQTKIQHIKKIIIFLKKKIETK